MKIKSLVTQLTLLPLLVAFLFMTACHTPMRDTPQGRHKRSRGGDDSSSGKVETQADCAPYATAFAALQNTSTVIDLNSITTAEFPPAQLETTLVRHVVFIFNRASKTAKPDLRFASVFVQADTCQAVSTFEASLGKPSVPAPAPETALLPKTEILVCAPPTTTGARERLVLRTSLSPAKSPYETWLGTTLNEQFTVDLSDKSSPKVVLHLTAKDTCQDVLIMSRHLSAPGKPKDSGGSHHHGGGGGHGHHH